jgi:predicted short-subunit dehydrogenase-like oxidoreductase (DUF2520 family)
MAEPRRPAIAVIGAGRLAAALLPLLEPAGYRLSALCARRLADARRLARGMGEVVITTRPEEAARAARLVLLAVPDRAIAPLASQLAKASGLSWKGRTVLHHAGALGLAPLAPLARAGAATGVLHPMQCLGRSRMAAALLPGSRARIEGDRRGHGVTRRLARDLGLVPLRMPANLDDADRAAYHAAASLLSNDIVALLAVGLRLLAAVGLSRREGLQALATLARGTLIQAELGGLEAALSGPVSRGDRATSGAQLAALSRQSPAASRAHRQLALELVRLARAGRRPTPTV